MKFSEITYMAIFRLDFWYFITELVMINPNLGIPALEDEIFANLLIFDYLYYERNFSPVRDPLRIHRGSNLVPK